MAGPWPGTPRTPDSSGAASGGSGGAGGGMDLQRALQIVTKHYRSRNAQRVCRPPMCCQRVTASQTRTAATSGSSPCLTTGPSISA